MKASLLVIDMQKGIFDLRQPVYDKENLIRNVKLALGYAREKGVKVIFSKHGNNTFLKAGTEGHEIIGDIETLKGDTIIVKKHPDIFQESGFDEILKEEGISSLIIAGLISNGCVRAACLSSIKRHYGTTLLKDAHSTFYKDAAKIIEGINREMETAGVRMADVYELCTAKLI